MFNIFGRLDRLVYYAIGLIVCVFAYYAYNISRPETKHKNNKAQFESAQKYCHSMNINCEIINCQYDTECGICDVKYDENKILSLECCDNFCEIRSIKQ